MVTRQRAVYLTGLRDLFVEIRGELGEEAGWTWIRDRYRMGKSVEDWQREWGAYRASERANKARGEAV